MLRNACFGNVNITQIKYKNKCMRNVRGLNLFSTLSNTTQHFIMQLYFFVEPIFLCFLSNITIILEICPPDISAR